MDRHHRSGDGSGPGASAAGPRVLVTDGMQKKALAVVRAIAGTASEIGVASSYPASMAGVSRYADRRHRIVAADDDEYVRRLNEVIEAGGYDHVLPVGGRTFGLLSARRDDLRVPIGRILPPRASMETALDKRRVHELATELGIPSPTTVPVERWADLERAADVVGFPLVFKTGVETETRFVRRIDSMPALRRTYLRYRRDYGAPALVQQLLEGDGRGYFGLYVDGERLASYTHRRIREYPVSGGASACAESGQDAVLREYGSRLLDALDWAGVVMVEFKDDAEGNPHVIEVNPKFWGSLDLAIESGLNFPALLLEHATGGDVGPGGTGFTAGRVHWPLSGDVQHALRRPEAARSVIGDALSPRTASNLRPDDPLPHLAEFGKALARPVFGGERRDRVVRSGSGATRPRNGRWCASATASARRQR